MRRFILASLMLMAAAAAAGEEPLRLACRTGGDGPQQSFAFSIDLAAQEAVETRSGRRFAASARQDHIVLSDGGMPVFRIDRITGAFTVDRQLRVEGQCDRVERKF